MNPHSTADYAADQARAATASPWFERLARIGYATKGVVYAIIGVLAVQAALGAGGATQGSQGAIRTIGEQPFGQVLLVLTAIGLLGYALWRFVQAGFDTSAKGDDAEGAVKRVGYVVSGLIYLFLAYQAAAFVFGWSIFGGSGGGGSSQQEWTARLLQWPLGPWLVGLVGAIFIGVGLDHFRKAYQHSFMKQYKIGAMSDEQRKAALWAGRLGVGARGVVFVIIGVFLIRAAVQSDPSEARGLSGALDALAAQPFGPWLLALVALGLVAYGVHCFFRARYRHFEPAEE